MPNLVSSFNVSDFPILPEGLGPAITLSLEMRRRLYRDLANQFLDTGSLDRLPTSSSRSDDESTAQQLWVDLGHPSRVLAEADEISHWRVFNVEVVEDDDEEEEGEEEEDYNDDGRDWDSSDIEMEISPMGDGGGFEVVGGAANGFLERLKEERGLVAEEGEELGCCAVCLEEVMKGEEVIKLGCSHVFHQCCVFSWLKKKATYPLCRHRTSTMDDKDY